MDVSQTIFEEYTDDLGPEKIIHILTILDLRR